MLAKVIVYDQLALKPGDTGLGGCHSHTESRQSACWCHSVHCNQSPYHCARWVLLCCHVLGMVPQRLWCKCVIVGRLSGEQIGDQKGGVQAQQTNF